VTLTHNGMDVEQENKPKNRIQNRKLKLWPGEKNIKKQHFSIIRVQYDDYCRTSKAGGFLCVYTKHKRTNMGITYIILLYRTRLRHDMILCGLLSNFPAILYR